ncbi:polysaccharide deacetylase family protein [Microbulbifer aggregans]|uniref:polysaccharide deacetylase family protein n=1 Tax=Microbulbifer aggregans TaxID=1769779 RepID=UPI001CFD8D19|nr:polysaccharide deacetylase family protein [Microbulbifer aggregans]
MSGLKSRRYFFALCLLATTAANASETVSPWPGGAEAAVILTYDDALDSHLDVAVPQLAQFNLPGTFYLSGARPSIRLRLEDWRKAAAAGHELGNHTLYHPCSKSAPGRDWVKPWHDLDRYSLEQFIDELQTTNSLLTAIDGEQQRSFAYPCGDMNAGGADVVAAIKPLVVAARFFSADGLHRVDDPDYFRLEAYDGAGKSAQDLIAVVEAARANNNLVGFMFHGVGGDYLSVSAEAHQALLKHLSMYPERYWVSTVRDAVAHLESAQ